MESGIKYTYHRYIRHQLFAGIYTDQVSRVMKRSQIVAGLNSFDHLIIDYCRTGELLTTVYHTMTYSTNLIQALNSTSLVISQSVKNHRDSFFMSRHRSFCDLLVQAGLLIGQTSVNTDSLAKTLCQNFFTFGVDQLIFQRRTAAVDYQYIHCKILLNFMYI